MKTNIRKKKLNSLEEVTSLLGPHHFVPTEGILAFEEMDEEGPIESDMKVL